MGTSQTTKFAWRTASGQICYRIVGVEKTALGLVIATYRETWLGFLSHDLLKGSHLLNMKLVDNVPNTSLELDLL